MLTFFVLGQANFFVSAKVILSYAFSSFLDVVTTLYFVLVIISNEKECWSSLENGLKSPVRLRDLFWRSHALFLLMILILATDIPWLLLNKYSLHQFFASIQVLLLPVTLYFCACTPLSKPALKSKVKKFALDSV
jgi:hypothetical protein